MYGKVWPTVTRSLKEHGIKCELNLVEGSMTVRTTRKCFDPFIILKARDLIKLLSRGVPVAQVRYESMYVLCWHRVDRARRMRAIGKRRGRWWGR